jgi:magnesium chelatase family protein
MLIAAMNACRCGADGSPGSCRCPEVARARYAGRVSGPLLDRFDLRIRVRRPDVEALLGTDDGEPSPSTPGGPNESSAVVAARVADARRRAEEVRGVSCNAEVPGWRLGRMAPLNGGAKRLLERRLRDGRLSARGLDRARRVALTVADLDGHDGALREEHVLLALALREPDPLGCDASGSPAGSAAPGTGWAQERARPEPGQLLGLARP